MSDRIDTSQSPPVVLPLDDQLPASKGDVKEAKMDIRREMRLTVVAALVGGQTLAALVASYVAAPRPTQAALETIASLFPLV